MTASRNTALTVTPVQLQIGPAPSRDERAQASRRDRRVIPLGVAKIQKATQMTVLFGITIYRLRERVSFQLWASGPSLRRLVGERGAGMERRATCGA